MATETWIDPTSHYQATGQVSGGRMTDATITDNNGITRDRNRTFNSKADFIAWVKRSV